MSMAAALLSFLACRPRGFVRASVRVRARDTMGTRDGLHRISWRHARISLSPGVFPHCTEPCVQLSGAASHPRCRARRSRRPGPGSQASTPTGHPSVRTWATPPGCSRSSQQVGPAVVGLEALGTRGGACQPPLSGEWLQARSPGEADTVRLRGVCMPVHATPSIPTPALRALLGWRESGLHCEPEPAGLDLGAAPDPALLPHETSFSLEWSTPGVPSPQAVDPGRAAGGERQASSEAPSGALRALARHFRDSLSGAAESLPACALEYCSGPRNSALSPCIPGNLRKVFCRSTPRTPPHGGP